MKFNWLRYEISKGVTKVKTKIAIALSVFGLLIGGSGLSLALIGSAHAERPLGAAEGGLRLSDPRQNIWFKVSDSGPESGEDGGIVDYQNFEYPGGLHYTANVLCVTAGGADARFMYQIPEGFPGLSGLYVVIAVHDGGLPDGVDDTYGHTATADLTTAQDWCENGTGVTNYPIIGGNLRVH